MSLVLSFGISSPTPTPPPTWVREQVCQWDPVGTGAPWVREELLRVGKGQASPAGTQADLKMVQEHRLAELEIQPESHLWRRGPELGP